MSKDAWEQELELLRQEAPEGGSTPAETEADAAAEQAAREAEQAFERRLEKAIDRRIRKICLKTIAVVAAVCAVVFLGINPVLSLCAPSPQRLSRSSDVSLEEYLSAYYETTRPYVEFYPSTDEELREQTQNHGFGRYTVGLNAMDTKQSYINLTEPNVLVTLNWGQYEVKSDPEGVLTRSWTSLSGAEEVRTELEDLPRASYGYLSVRTNEPVSLETLRESGLDVNWIEVYTETESVEGENYPWRGGLNTSIRVSQNGDDWRQDMSSDELRQVYLENLETLLSVPRLLGQLSFDVEMTPDDILEGLSSDEGVVSSVGWYVFDGDSVAAELQETYDAVAAQTGPLMTERYCISGSRDELLSFLDTADIQYVGIDNVNIDHTNG